jgi:hypothetical protein
MTISEILSLCCSVDQYRRHQHRPWRVGEWETEVVRLRAAIKTRDEAGWYVDGRARRCAYCGAAHYRGVDRDEPHTPDCPTVTHPMDKEGCR